MTNTATHLNLELADYLRVNRASLSEWLAAIREISGCDDIECRLHRGGGPVGNLSSLETDYGRVVCIHVSQGVDVTGCRTADPVFLLPLAGDPEVVLQSGKWQPLKRLVIARPEDRFNLRLPENSRVMILRQKAGTLDGFSEGGSEWQLSACQEVIECYLHHSPFFRDDAHARAVTGDLFLQLAGIASNEETPPCECPELDRRLFKVIEKIRQEPDWEFNLRELANHSGVSERNLYYLMERETGITPYRFYQRDRLIRVRHRIVDCQCEIPHISRYASDEGFSHLGRFAALYREHFGELPSETVQWRRRLQEIPA
ncbi:helix-turn-helix domain-containing protein [Marinobacter sp. CHS3-4]|uniref:helix-turn-helix domain-containing protein n=1 Tax=Marinobacter sp. CHS3-4 TaxID=3045174 RepID=UPI0024B5022C|nr:helix-turn-helix domain-containing protein [Marinobacter sp. CHS3-4]MDI9244216.1 helix-turn-helix domain-containing protein [Marinobacter sp. CHS3-4]